MATSVRIGLGLVASMLVLVLLWQLPDWLDQPETPPVILDLSHCDLAQQRRCLLRLDQQTQVLLTVANDNGPSVPIRSLQPLTFKATLTGIEATHLRLDLKGKEMYMGINQTPMSRQPHTQHWQGSTELAVCTTGEMIWQAWLHIDRGPLAAPINAVFEFKAK